GAFDLAADLVDILPGLCVTLRDRQTLTLLEECQQLLHQADLASPREPLDPARLQEYVVRLCRSVAAILDCADVAVYLAEAAPGADAAPLSATAAAPLATGARPPPAAGGALPGPGSRSAGPPAPAAGDRSDPAGTDGAVTRPLVSGRSEWGRLRCAGPRQPPVRLSAMDGESLNAVAVQLSQYWSNWLHRRRISAENSCWNRLATGSSAFNQRVSEGLSRGGPRARSIDGIDDIALKVVLDVVPECIRVDVWDVTGGQLPGSAVTVAHRAARGPEGDLVGEHAAVPESVQTLL